MKKYNQNLEGKKQLEDNSKLLELFKKLPNRPFTKQELMAYTSKNERAVRAELEHIANFYPIRATAGRKGYLLLELSEDADITELKDINNEAFLQVCELENRIKSLKARMKPLIALMRVTAVKLQEKGVDTKDE